MAPKISRGKSEAEIISFAASFDMSKIVRRYCKDSGTTQEIGQRYEKELKRYLTLCALHPAANYGMRGPVDEPSLGARRGIGRVRRRISPPCGCAFAIWPMPGLGLATCGSGCCCVAKVGR